MSSLVQSRDLMNGIQQGRSILGSIPIVHDRFLQSASCTVKANIFLSLRE